MSKEQFETLKEKKFMRAIELSKYIGIGLSTFYMYRKEGRFSGIKVSSKVVIYNVKEVEKALFGEVS